MTVAVTGAFAIGQWPEAAMVMALYAIAELIEARSVDRARNAIKGLLDMTPEKTEVRQADGSWVECLVKTVSIGTTIRVKPGARVPLDGVIVTGTTSVDQSPVTGESIPVDKTIGDIVFAGTINTTGMFELRVSAMATGTLLARIIYAVEQAQRVTRAHSTVRGPFRFHLHASCVRFSTGSRPADPLAVGLDLDARRLHSARAAGHCLSMRTGDLHARDISGKKTEHQHPRHL